MNLLRGLPGHPFHPPLTGATIGAYTFATAMAVLSKLGVSEHNTATAWWLAAGHRARLHHSDGDHGLRRLALHRRRDAALAHRDDPSERDADGDGRVRDHRRSRARRLHDGSVGGGSLVLTLVGYVLLAAGGWLGGAIVFTHGMRVLKLVDDRRAGDLRAKPRRKRPRPSSKSRSSRRASARAAPRARSSAARRSRPRRARRP